MTEEEIKQINGHREQIETAKSVVMRDFEAYLQAEIDLKLEHSGFLDIDQVIDHKPVLKVMQTRYRWETSLEILKDIVEEDEE